MHVQFERPAGGVPADVVVTTSGMATLREVMELRAALTGLDDVGHGARILVDHTLVDPTEMGTDEARILGERLRALAGDVRPATRVALVAEAPAVYGSLRQMLTYAEIDAERAGLPQPTLCMEVFARRDDAIAWLGPPAA